VRVQVSPPAPRPRASSGAGFSLWRNGQRARLRIAGLGVRVPPGRPRPSCWRVVGTGAFRRRGLAQSGQSGGLQSHASGVRIPHSLLCHPKSSDPGCLGEVSEWPGPPLQRASHGFESRLHLQARDGSPRRAGTQDRRRAQRPEAQSGESDTLMTWRFGGSSPPWSTRRPASGTVGARRVPFPRRAIGQPARLWTWTSRFESWRGSNTPALPGALAISSSGESAALIRRRCRVQVSDGQPCSSAGGDCRGRTCRHPSYLPAPRHFYRQPGAPAGSPLYLRTALGRDRSWTCSSAGRALGLHPRCRRFEPSTACRAGSSSGQTRQTYPAGRRAGSSSGQTRQTYPAGRRAGSSSGQTRQMVPAARRPRTARGTAGASPRASASHTPD
jgi:hypothetical protein